jgi:hypothetical protein
MGGRTAAVARAVEGTGDGTGGQEGRNMEGCMVAAGKRLRAARRVLGETTRNP